MDMDLDARAAELEALTRELQAITAPLALELRPTSAFQIVAALQLALRHPGLTGVPRQTAERLVHGIREYFAGSPTIQQLIDRGNDPQYDEVREPRGPLHDVQTFYRSLQTAQLEMMRQAFLLDRAHARPASVDFCDERIRLIDDALRRRRAGGEP